jgi:polar amino acid transport system substrate-binding protein
MPGPDGNLYHGIVPSLVRSYKYGHQGTPSMARRTGLPGLLCATIAVIWALSGCASTAKPLRLVADFAPPFEDLGNEKTPGYSVKVLRQVLAAMGQDASIEAFPNRRSWKMIASGEADGIFGGPRTGERERICSFPDEPLIHDRWVLFVRTADIGKLKFASFDDLIGHRVAVPGMVPGLFERSIMSPELWRFLREHDNMVETNGALQGLQMLAAGRVDYAFSNLSTGKRNIATTGLAGKIEPLLSHGVVEGGQYVCFSKARVDPALVEAFSQALKQFKQTEAFQAIYSKYFP